MALVEGSVDHDHQPTGEVAQRVLEGEGQNERGAANQCEYRRDVDAQPRQHDHQSEGQHDPVGQADEEDLQQLRQVRHTDDIFARYAPDDPRDEEQTEQRGEDHGDIDGQCDPSVLGGGPSNRASHQRLKIGVACLLDNDRVAVGAELRDRLFIATLFLPAVHDRRIAVEQRAARLRQLGELLPRLRCGSVIVVFLSLARRDLRRDHFLGLGLYDVAPGLCCSGQLADGQRRQAQRELVNRNVRHHNRLRNGRLVRIGCVRCPAEARYREPGNDNGGQICR